MTWQHAAEAVLGLLSLVVVGMIFIGADLAREDVKLRRAWLRSTARDVSKMNAAEVTALYPLVIRARAYGDAEMKRRAALIEKLAERRMSAILRRIIRERPVKGGGQ